MPRIKFLTFDFGSAKRTDPILPEDRNSQIIQNIKQKYRREIPNRDRVVIVPVVLLLAAGIAAFSLIRYGILQKENFSLNDEVRKLNVSIEALEAENKDLASRTARAEKERQNLKDAIDGYKKENESIKFESKKNEDKINSLTEEKSYLEEILINKTKEIERLSAGGAVSSSVAATPISSVTTGSEDLVQRLNQKEEEIRKLNEQNRLLNEKLQKLYQTADSKMKEINIAKIALEDTISDAKKVIDNEYGSVNLGSIAVTSQAAQSSQNAAVPAVSPTEQRSATETRTAPKKQGRVLAINEEHGFVVIDMGKVDGIKTGMNLYLKKDGETVATLSVLEVRDVMTACNIRNLTGGQKIQINDLVSVQN